MRRIDPVRFQVATRGTSRSINRQIALTLVRTRQPISRADLARLMGVRRGAVSLIINELITERLIFEGATGETRRGRKPTFLYIDSRRRSIVAVDVRVSRTYLMATDRVGRQLQGVISFPTPRTPKQLVAELSRRIKRLLADHPELGTCEGVGVALPGMVEWQTGRLLHAPTLNWRDVDLKTPLAAAVGIPVHVENSGKACALAQIWNIGDSERASGDLVFVSISDGVGVGVVINGSILRGQHSIAGEFGHVPLNIDGPTCSCGATGCWEAYVSNLATISRYFGRPLESLAVPDEGEPSFTVDDLIVRARTGDAKALAAIQTTGRYLGLGIATIVNALDPSRVYLSGEITGAWDLIESIVRSVLAERALMRHHAETSLAVVPAQEYPRLKGAAALVAAPAFAAPVVA